MPAPSAQLEAVVASFQQAAEANRQTPARRGSVVVLTAENADDVLVTADLHGRHEHFESILQLAALDRHPRRHLILQEVCHGGPCYPDGQGCRSHLLLTSVARLKVRYPERVHFLMSNHELSELTDYPILKARRMLNLSFRLGLQAEYGDRLEEVRQAYLPFIRSCPLAIRFDNVFVSHSLPENVDRRPFDASFLDRPLTEDDWRVQGPIFDLVWGRDFRPANAEAFAKLVHAEVLIHGHEPCSDGFRVPNERQVILDTCGSKPTVALLPVGRPLQHAEVVERIQYLS